MSQLEQIRDQQKDQWNQFSTGWKKWDALIMRSLEGQGNALLNSAPENWKNALDVATGTGEPGLTLAAKNPDGTVTGTDLSEGMLEVALERARQLGLQNYRTQVADACELPFPDAAFDALFCRLGIMFFPDPGKGVAEFHRVLAPESWIGLTVWGTPTANPWLAIAALTVREVLELPAPPPDAPGVFRFAEPDALASLLRECGFRNVAQEEISGDMEFESADQYLDMILDVAAPIVSALQQATPDQQETAQSLIRERIASHADAQGQILLPWSAWLVTAYRQ